MTSAGTPTILFKRLVLIGQGLIGSSVARAVQDYARDHVESLVLYDGSPEVRARLRELAIGDEVPEDPASAVAGADGVMFCVPVGANSAVAEQIGPLLERGCIVTDVGSVKQSFIRDVSPFLPDGVHLVPGHPVAGTEHSGPDAGFGSLFQDRWSILTPPPGVDERAVARISKLWELFGSNVEIMDAAHHDLVLAVTSHLPHLIAYTIVGTASDLETVTEKECVKFAAGGFRDFTRIAASDPVMWRDVFLNNREAALEILGRFTEDLFALQRAIRWGEGEALEELFTRTRKIRREVIEARQAYDPSPVPSPEPEGS